SWRRNPLKYLQSHRRFRDGLLEVTEQTSPRAVIFENVDLARTALSIAKEHPKLPLIYWGTELSCSLRQTPFRYYERRLARMLTGLVMNHPGRVRVVKERTKCDVPAIVIPNTETRPENGGGVFERRPLREMFARHNPDVKVIIFYAGIVSHKQAIHDVVEALALVPAHIGFAFPRSVGNRRYLKKIDATVRRLGLSSRIVYPDWVPFDKVPEMAASADIGLALLRVNDLNTRYCASSKLYRYMCVGLPLLGASLPAIADIIEAEKIGVTCDVESTESIAAAIRRLDDADLRWELRRNAIEAFDKRHCLEVQWQKHRGTLMDWIGGG
ncbi:unnamed protein product, partial [marine sediment metagenome]